MENISPTNIDVSKMEKDINEVLPLATTDNLKEIITFLLNRLRALCDTAVDQEEIIVKIRDQLRHGVPPASGAYIGPTARHSDPDTSHAAANVAKFSCSKHRKIALLTLYEHGPLTDFELSDITGIQHSSIGKRRKDCFDYGLVEYYVINDVRVKRPTKTGCKALVYVLSPRGKAYVEEHLLN